MQSPTPIVDTFIEKFSHVLKNCPIVNSSFYDSFAFTTTGKNYAHPRTLGLLAKALYSLPGIVAVDVDVRFNEPGGVKFEPDLVGLDEKGNPLIIVDFESPNSSDARIPTKDVEPYAKWVDSIGCAVPYLIITSLPKKPNGKWKLLYTSEGRSNEKHKKFAVQIKARPFSYWYGVYCKELNNLNNKYPRLRELPLYFANLDGLELGLVNVWNFSE